MRKLPVLPIREIRRASSISPAPKPTPKPLPEKRSRSSIREKTHAEKLALLRAKPQKPRTPVKKKRRTKGEDFRVYGPPEFRDFLHAHACLGCGVVGYSVQAHIHTGGKSRKDDYRRTAPLCGSRWAKIGFSGVVTMLTGCHHDYDHAKQSWPKAMGIDIEVAQDRFWSEYEDHCETLGVDP